MICRQLRIPGRVPAAPASPAMPGWARAALAALLATAMFGCGGEGPADSGAAGAAAASDTVGTTSPVGEPFALPQPPPMMTPAALVAVASEPVTGRAGPGGAPFRVALRTPDIARSITRRIGMQEFDLALRLRTPDLTQYPCTSCHFQDQAMVPDQRIEDAHMNIEPVHPAETGATCATCHAPENVGLLVLQSGERVSLDHAYRLCAQCHYAPVDDWAAGAHGKRLDGWHGERVVMGCADCHDPHRPALEPRLPYPGPMLPRSGGRHP